MKRFFAVLALAALPALDPASATPLTYSIDKAHSNVAFQIRHYVTQVHGHFGEFSGSIVKDDENPANATVVFEIQTASIDTGNEKRDDDLRGVDFFDTATYPALKFASNRIEKQPDGSYRVTGNLTMHGVTKALTLPVTFAGEMSDGRGSFHAGFSTSITLNRKEFGITWNRVLDNGGAMLGDEVEVQIDLEAVRK
jgi:polyisoprenoid-binding protein YceI